MLATQSATIPFVVIGEDEMLPVSNATVSLGNPVTIPVLVPVKHSSTPTCISDPFMVNGECYRVTAMSFGTPHGAVFVDDVEDVDVPKIGRALGTHALFPKGASIVFIQVLDKESIKVRLWQRGEGEYPITPEAACVAGTAAMMCQKVLFNAAYVTMDDVTFRMKWDRFGEGVTLTGPEDMLLV